MRLSDISDWINKHGHTLVTFILFALACFCADSWASFKVMMVDKQFLITDARTIRQMGAIDFMHENIWIICAYAAFFFATLLWMEIRNLPRWARWGAFAGLAAPWILYTHACIDLSGKFVLIHLPAHSM